MSKKKVKPVFDGYKVGDIVQVKPSGLVGYVVLATIDYILFSQQKDSATGELYFFDNVTPVPGKAGDIVRHGSEYYKIVFFESQGLRLEHVTTGQILCSIDFDKVTLWTPKVGQWVKISNTNAPLQIKDITLAVGGFVIAYEIKGVRFEAFTRINSVIPVPAPAPKLAQRTVTVETETGPEEIAHPKELLGRDCRIKGVTLNTFKIKSLYCKTGEPIRLTLSHVRFADVNVYLSEIVLAPKEKPVPEGSNVAAQAGREHSKHPDSDAINQVADRMHEKLNNLVDPEQLKKATARRTAEELKGGLEIFAERVNKAVSGLRLSGSWTPELESLYKAHKKHEAEVRAGFARKLHSNIFERYRSGDAINESQVKIPFASDGREKEIADQLKKTGETFQDMKIETLQKQLDEARAKLKSAESESGQMRAYLNAKIDDYRRLLSEQQKETDRAIAKLKQCANSPIDFIRIGFMVGTDIQEAARAAVDMATLYNESVNFLFNEIFCEAYPNTDAEILVKRYHRALKNNSKAPITSKVERD